MSRPDDGSIGFDKPRELQVAEAAAQAGRRRSSVATTATA